MGKARSRARISHGGACGGNDGSDCQDPAVGRVTGGSAERSHVHCNTKIISRGQTIFWEEKNGSGFYVTISGIVKIFKTSPDGKEQILHIFGPNEPFGEAPVFEGRNFPAHAVALEDSRCLFFRGLLL